MQQKLIEHWLDSIGERGYQPAFIQMLLGEGHTVLHSTRHSPIEFGKDVISIDANGTPCAFQLKGNPSSRLTLAQWREIRSQITELVEQPIVYPGIPSKPHKCFLVTNGEVDEEVQRAVDDLNRGFATRQFHENQRVSIISRGTLLAWAVEHAGDYWPDDFSVHEKLIKMYNIDGREQPDLALFSAAFSRILRLSVDDKSFSKPAFRRAMLSAAIFVSLASRNYVTEKNFNAVIGVWTALLAAYASASEKHGINLEDKHRQPYFLVREVLFDNLFEMIQELQNKTADLSHHKSSDPIDINRVYLQGGALSDRVLWNARALKTLSLLALWRIEAERNSSLPKLTEGQEAVVSNLCENNRTNLIVWGEGAVPQIFAHVLAERLFDATIAPNLALYQILLTITKSALHSDKQYFPTPYHGLEDCIRDTLKEVLSLESSKVADDTQKRSSFMAEGLLHCFVRTNLKTFAKSIWPDMTRLTHNSFYPEIVWEYCLWRAEQGENKSKQFEHRKNWLDLQMEASSVDTPSVPKALRDDPVILMAFSIYFPHRALPEVFRYLHYSICGTWFLPFPKPEIDL